MELEGGETIAYDWLVLALGAETRTLGIPGVKEHAMPFSTYDDAVAVRREAGGAAECARAAAVDTQGGRLCVAAGSRRCSPPPAGLSIWPHTASLS